MRADPDLNLGSTGALSRRKSDLCVALSPENGVRPDVHVSRNGPSRASVFAPVASEADAESGIAADARGDEESVFVFPASPAQRRFWLLDQLQPGGNPALNLSLALGWHGPLDQFVLQRALNEVVARHEALRTTFDYQRGELRQLIAPSLVLELPLSGRA